MAMKLIKKEELTENGVVYINETYQSDKTGKESVVKYPKPSDIPKEPEAPEATDEELAQAEMLLMQSEILANQMAQDEVLAEILLNQMEV